MNGSLFNKVKILNVVFDGNSITAGQGVTVNERFPNLLFSDVNLNKWVGGINSNIAVGGQTTADMISRQSSFLYPKFIPGFNNLVIVMEVRNDLQLGATDQQAYDNIKTYCQNCISNGFEVILVNQTPSTGGTPVGRTQPQMETSRQWVRSQILVDFPNATNKPLVYTPGPGITYATLVCDVGGDSVMGNVANCADLSLYQDGTHPSATGHLNLKEIIKRAQEYYISSKL